MSNRTLTIDGQKIADPDTTKVLETLVPIERKNIPLKDAVLYLNADQKDGFDKNDFLTLQRLYPKKIKFTESAYLKAGGYIDYLSKRPLSAISDYFPYGPNSNQWLITFFSDNSLKQNVLVQTFSGCTVDKTSTPTTSSTSLLPDDKCLKGERVSSVTITDLGNGKVKLELKVIEGYANKEWEETKFWESGRAHSVLDYPKTISTRTIEISKGVVRLTGFDFSTETKTIPAKTRNLLWDFVMQRGSFLPKPIK